MITYYWSKTPGNFVNKLTGESVSGASFTGSQDEWFETLVETIVDVAHKANLTGDILLVGGVSALDVLSKSILWQEDHIKYEYLGLKKMKLVINGRSDKIVVYDRSAEQVGEVVILS